MPYPGVPPAKPKEMESCVRQVMGQGKDKSTAIAICHKSIMGSKKVDLPNITLNINLADYWKSQMEESEVEISDEEKIDGEGGENMTKQEEEVLKAMDAGMKACMTGHMKEGKTMQEAKDMCQKEMDEKKKVDGEEVKEEVSEEAAVSTEEASAEEAKEETVEESTEEAAEEAPAEEVAAEAPAEEVAQADKTADLVKQVLARLDEIGESLKKQDDSASAEGATSGDEPAAPEGGEGDSPVEEKAPASPDQGGSEDASPEGAEKVEKVDAEGINKIADQIEKLNKSFEDKFTALDARLTKVEAQPVPSAVVSPKVVSKVEDRKIDQPHQERLDQIKEELDKLEDIKIHDMETYQKQRMWEKAFNLINERNQLMQVE